MAAPLSAILEALAGEFDDGVFKDGPEHLAGQAPPSIVAVPTDEDFGEPENYEADLEVDALAQRGSNVVFRIWGKDRAGVEELIATMVVALRMTTGRSHRLGKGVWIVKTAEAVITHGRAYELQVTFFVPVVAPAETIAQATVTSTDTTDAGVSHAP